jgi:hypothetical protein
LHYEAVDDAGKSVLTDKLDWKRPCDGNTALTVTWVVREQGSAAKGGKLSAALWIHCKRIAGAARTLEPIGPGRTQTFKHRLSVEETARGRVSLFAQGSVAVVSFEIWMDV